MWKTVKLGDVCQIQPKKAQVKARLKNSDKVSFMPMKELGIQNMYPKSTQIKKLEKVYNSYTYFEDNDILLAKITPCFENGKLGIASNLMNGVGFGSSEYIVLRCGEKVIPQYIYFCLSQPSFRNIGKNQMSGAVGHKRIPKEYIESTKIYLPPIAEQERIVAKLDAAFAAIDEAINIINKNISSYSNLSLGIMQEVLNNDLYQWEIKNLSSLSENLDSKRVPITKSKRIAGNVPYYGASGIVDYVEEFIFDDDLLLISEDGANLLTRSYPIAFSISGKSWVNNHAHVLKFKSLQLQEWVQLYLNSTNLSPYISGMAQPKLNQKKLNEIPIPCPHSEMLDELLNMVASTKKNIEEILVVEAKKIKELNKLKSAILTQELQSNEAA